MGFPLRPFGTRMRRLTARPPARPPGASRAVGRRGPVSSPTSRLEHLLGDGHDCLGLERGLGHEGLLHRSTGSLASMTACSAARSSTSGRSGGGRPGRARHLQREWRAWDMPCPVVTCGPLAPSGGRAAPPMWMAHPPKPRSLRCSGPHAYPTGVSASTLGLACGTNRTCGADIQRYLADPAGCIQRRAFASRRVCLKLDSSALRMHLVSSAEAPSLSSSRAVGTGLLRAGTVRGRMRYTQRHLH